MTGTNLAAEFSVTVRAIHQHHLDHITALGVSGAALVAIGLIGVAAIETDRHGLYQPADHGRPALIVAAWDRPPIRPDGSVAWDAVPVDLVAVRTDDPGRWWLRRGSVCLLGDHMIDYYVLGADPVRVHRDPIAWLRAGGDGVVVLEDDGYDILANLPAGLVAEDVEHGERIKARLARPFKTPPIFIAETVRTAA